MFISLATPFEMRQSDISTITHYGLPETLLMENAGREAFSAITQQYGNIAHKRCFVFAGSGNNGGDGLVLARYLKEAGAHVIVILEKDIEAFPSAALWHYNIAQRYGVQCISIEEFYSDIASSITPDIIIDALLGIGFTGELKENIQQRIHYINAFSTKSYIISLDIPSGLHCLTGTPSPLAVKAHLTITFHMPKVCLYMPEAQEYIGKIAICNIGIPSNIHQYKYQVALHPPSTPSINKSLHKHSAGRVLVIGGSEEYIGAPLFAAQSARRMGAGSVTIASLQHTIDKLATVGHENIFLPLPYTEWSALAFSAIIPHLHKYNALIVGPGMGSYAGVKDFLFALLQYPQRPLTIFDADAVRNIPLLHSSVSALLQSTDILTPHIGELAHMLATSSANIKKNKLDIAHICKQKSDATLVIKDAGTLIVQKNEPITISPFLSPNLAIAGSGDILSGMIAGESLKRENPFLAACAAVYYHAKVGEYLYKDFPFRGNTPYDILHSIAPVLKEVHQ